MRRRSGVVLLAVLLAAVLAGCEALLAGGAGSVAGSGAASATPAPSRGRAAVRARGATPTATKAAMACGVVATGVKGGHLFVRDAPGGDAVGVLAEGEEVALSGEAADGWARIAAPLSGWVAARFVRSCDERRRR